MSSEPVPAMKLDAAGLEAAKAAGRAAFLTVPGTLASAISDSNEAAIRAYLATLSAPVEVGTDHIADAGKMVASRPVPLGEAVAIKPLKWRDQRGHSFPDIWDAVTPCGVYEIEERSASDSPAYVVTGPLYAFISDKDSLDEAKAAAQTDYEKRIRSTLYAEPQASVRDAVLEALAEIESARPGAFWIIGKGRVTEGEPLFGCQILFGTDEVLASGEGDTIADAIRDAIRALSNGGGK